MKCNQREMPSKPYLYPGIFGDRVLDLGLKKAVEIFDPAAAGYPDSVKSQYKLYMEGIVKEMSMAENNLLRQKQFLIYFEELDRRRGTDFKKIFPRVAEWLEDIN
jgi:hypothetical protein